MKKRIIVSLVVVAVVVAMFFIVSSIFLLNCAKAYAIVEMLDTAENSGMLDSLRPIEFIVEEKPDRIVFTHTDLNSYVTLYYACRSGYVEISFHTNDDESLGFLKRDYQLFAARIIEIGNAVFQNKWWIVDADMYADMIDALWSEQNQTGEIDD